MLKKYGLYCAWVLATIGTLTSLYFSEIRHMEPCHLCWYQRIMLFPLVYLLGLGLYKGEEQVAIYAFPMIFLGLIFSGYQILIQEIPDWNPIDVCGAGPSCAEKISIGLGFITIPILSFVNFFAIGLLLTIKATTQETKKPPNH